MKINVGQIEKRIGDRQSFHFDVPVGMVCDNTANFWLTGNITVEGKIVNTGIELSLEGTVRGKAQQTCTRCLKEFESMVEVPFNDTYRKLEENATVDPDGEILVYHGDEINITDLIRETLFLAEPLKALCSESCRGICQKCGADRNITPCSCDTEVLDPRFAALRQLLDKK
jgi:uncharacterized protein